MPSSSFYTDGETYDTAVVTSNDNPASTDPSQAPSSFYPDGTVYDTLADSDELTAQFLDDLQQAAASVTAAAQKAIDAAASAGLALQDETAAANSAQAAKTSEDNAKTSETNAAASAASASSHDADAQTQATNAANSAAAALASETAAANSESNAAGSATSAGVQAQAAAASAVNASTSEAHAKTSETNAASSATDAANSASTVASALSAYAPLASPALTGTPTAPTPAANDNSTKLATTAFVLGQASNSTPSMDSGSGSSGIGGSYARSDHVHPTDTSRAPLASPAFTGTPTAPTPANGDNSTKLATTAFVLANATGTGAVRYDTAQALTSAQQIQGRHNLGSSIGIPDVIVEEQQPAGTNGGSNTPGSFVGRVLNTLVYNNNSIAALASNQVTLPAGTYFFKWLIPAYAVNGHQSALRNVTDASWIAFGTQGWTPTSGGTMASSEGSCVVTFTSSKTVALWQYTGSSQPTFGLGRALGQTTEVYSRLEITALS